MRHGRALANVNGSVQIAIKRGELEQFGSESDAIAIPLLSNNKIIGALMVQSYKEEIKFNLQDVKVLTFVAQHIATSLTRARALEETRQRNDELAIINRVQEGLASKLDMQAIYDLVGDKIRDIFDAQAVLICTFVIDEEEEKKFTPSRAIA